jgi:hypothetical protein
MLRERLIFVGTCDIAGHVRGQGLPREGLMDEQPAANGLACYILRQNHDLTASERCDESTFS